MQYPLYLLHKMKHVKNAKETNNKQGFPLKVRIVTLEEYKAARNFNFVSINIWLSFCDKANNDILIKLEPLPVKNHL